MEKPRMESGDKEKAFSAMKDIHAIEAELREWKTKKEHFEIGGNAVGIREAKEAISMLEKRKEKLLDQLPSF